MPTTNPDKAYAEIRRRSDRERRAWQEGFVAAHGMNKKARAIYIRIHELRDEIGPGDFSINEALREIRDG